MIWGFVDYENIGSLKDIDFSTYQELFIFCGPKNPNIKLGNAVISEFINIQIIMLNTNGVNNLDFHIAYYLGKFSQTAPKETQLHVITKDNGLNGLVSHIIKTGRICRKITLKIANWVDSQCRTFSKNINAKSVLRELAKAGLINVDDQVIKYTLKR